MFWADELAARVSGPQVINDSKTPSGTIHVGALRGVVMHDVIARAVRDRSDPVRFVYGIDDLDPMDSATLATREGVVDYMGLPLSEVPAPRGSAHASWARHFVHTFIDTFERLGIHPELYWASEQYAAGDFDAFIAEALDKAAEVLRVYREIGSVRHADDWHPLMVICESCGRIGTTYVDGWNGREVTYRCRPDQVDWAVGCGHRGSVSPFGGRAKLPWNLHWVAKWKHFGVTIEGAGKDLSTRGGSRDRADALAREVFGFEPPLNVPYEFLLIGGRKMKSSAATGAAADAVVEVLPPELVRFLMLRLRPRVAIEFDPDGTDAIPRLFDEYDRIAAATAGASVRGELPPDHDRIFALSLPEPHPDVRAAASSYRPAFGHLALLAQVPSVDVQQRIVVEKGAPLDEQESALLAERLRSARAWLATYAPDRARLTVRDELPEAAAELDDAQRGALRTLADALADVAWTGETLQAAIFDAARVAQLPAGRMFAALYLAFLGQPHGPRAGWLLASLDPAFVAERLRDAAQTDTLSHA